MRGAIGTGDVSVEQLVARARATRQMEGADLVSEVTIDAAFDFDLGAPTSSRANIVSDEEFFLPAAARSDASAAGTSQAVAAERPLVAAYDFGMKWNILRRLSLNGCRVRVFPASAPASDVLAARPAGVFLSNGPGDPAALGYVIDNVRRLLDANVPMFGICLGHQLLAQALGGKTFKLKFGHRGANHPVKDLETGKVEITSQNHGFAVADGSLPADVKVTHQSLYDGTIEGLRHRERPVFSVQYHPEASPGPHDADYLFGRFMAAVAPRS